MPTPANIYILYDPKDHGFLKSLETQLDILKRRQLISTWSADQLVAGAVVNLFWQQFCQNRGLKTAVRQILDGRIPDDRPALLALEDHGFIVQTGSGWALRVPLFRAWLERYRDV